MYFANQPHEERFIGFLSADTHKYSSQHLAAVYLLTASADIWKRAYDDYVCTDALGNLMRPNYITQHFGVFLEQNGSRKIRFHDLRHTCASLLLSNNIPLINVSRLLGHSTISTTANIYGHLDQTSMLETSEAMSAILKSAK